MGAGMGGWNEKVSSEKYFAPDTKTYYVIYTCFERCNNHKKLLKKTKGMTPQKEAPPNQPTERKKTNKRTKLSRAGVCASLHLAKGSIGQIMRWASK